MHDLPPHDDVYHGLLVFPLVSHRVVSVLLVILVLVLVHVVIRLYT
jgi:hypothetical protein